MELLIVIEILLMVGIICVVLTMLTARMRQKEIEADYIRLIRFYVLYIAEKESGPSQLELQEVRASYKRVINAKLHLTRPEPPIWGSLERYFRSGPNEE